MPILGTSVDAIDLAEDRGRFGDAARPPRLRGAAVRDGARRSTRRSSAADEVGFPLLVRPSLRARRPGDGDRLLARRPRRLPRPRGAGATATAARSSSTASWRTRSRSTSTRCATASDVWIGGIMQHVEEAGIHSGDSACVLPPHSLGREMLDRDPRQPREGIALGLGVVGLINVQYAVHARRALRHRGQPARVADRAVRLQGDRRAAGQDGLPAHARREASPTSTCPPTRCAGDHVSVKEAVLPFDRFEGADAVLGPGDALDRRGHGHRPRLPDARSPRRRPRPARRCRSGGTVFITVTDSDKAGAVGDRPDAARPRLPDRRHARHRRRRSARWASRRGAQQDRRGLAARRRLDRARRRRPRRQHADRLGRAHRRLGDPPRRGRRAACRASRRSRGGVAAARAIAAARQRRAAEVLSLQESAPASAPARVGAERLARAARRAVLSALDAETRAPRSAFAALRARRRLAPLRRCAAPAAPRDPALRVEALGLDLPSPLGARRRLRQGRDGVRRARRARASGSSRSGRSRRARSPATRGRGCSACRADRALVNRMGFNNRGRASGRARAWPRGAARRGRRRRTSARTRTTRRRRGRATTRPRARARRRSPTTSSSTSARRTRPGCATCRRSSSCAPLLDGGARRAAADGAPLLVKIAPDLADEDVDARRRPRARARARRDHRHEHDDRAATGCARAPARSTAAGAGGLSGAPLRARSLEVLRRLRARRRRPARARRRRRDRDADDAWERIARRGDARAGLHRLRLRRAAVAGASPRPGARCGAAASVAVSRRVGASSEASDRRVAVAPDGACGDRRRAHQRLWHKMPANTLLPASTSLQQHLNLRSRSSEFAASRPCRRPSDWV